jgi:hypothetical protein
MINAYLSVGQTGASPKGGKMKKLKCTSCGKPLRKDDVEWIGKGSNADPFKPFCWNCASKE